MDLGNSEILQQALAEFLERGYLAAHLARTIPEYRVRREALEHALARHLPRGWKWRRAQQGVSLWLPLPDGLDPQNVFEEAQRRGVIVHPGTLNAAAPERREPGIRLTFCAESAHRLVEGAKRLGKALAGLAPKLGASETATTETPTLGGI